ncbi:MAG: prepilin-type N-terminal cleavage/methylation domain-containing protein [Candidatus Gracilibacteria bacterium]|nr:prepilin-type N-terminal cleavage/methylation domain-containing protein [Candidatus Gracilibacteria bacterium]
MKTKNNPSIQAFHTNTKKPKLNTKFHGFTLVELIVVITILVILGTIAFLNLGGYSGNARDSSRVSDLTNLSKSLDVVSIKSGSYPTPDNSFLVTYSGGTIWTQGTIGSSVMNTIGAIGLNMNKKPTDPLIPSKEYTYSKLVFGKAYQIKSDWEGDTLAHTPLFINQAHADSGNPTLTYIKGNYNGMVAETQTGNIHYFLAAPSIITSESGTTDITLISSKFLVNGQTNSGGLANAVNPSKLLVYSSSSLPSTITDQRLFASGIANAYSGTALATTSQIQPYTAALASGDTAALENLGGQVMTTSFGGQVATSDPPINGACGTENEQTLIDNSTIVGGGACSLGTFSGSVTGAGPWTWQCAGNFGGTIVNCSATKGAAFAAIGGTVTTSGGYTIHKFTTSGTFQITNGTATNIEYLVVAGGGGGGNASGFHPGGGGAGGFLTGTLASLSAGNYTVTVGAGGAGGVMNGLSYKGNNSSFDTIIATGGGAGGAYGNSNSSGGSGGSGGGGNPTGLGGISSPIGQGNNGAAGNGTQGGGGGGAGGPGIGMSGGPGLISSISGSPVTYAAGGSAASSVSGVANTGNGGSGRMAYSYSGGSGIVIIRYITP